MDNATPITPHAQQAVTRLVAECRLMRIFDADAERIVQDAMMQASRRSWPRFKPRLIARLTKSTSIGCSIMCSVAPWPSVWFRPLTGFMKGLL